MCSLNTGRRQQGMEGQRFGPERSGEAGARQGELGSKLQGTVMETSDRSQGGIESLLENSALGRHGW